MNSPCLDCVKKNKCLIVCDVFMAYINEDEPVSVLNGKYKYAAQPKGMKLLLGRNTSNVFNI